jgi:hypothetical protein
MDADGTVGIGRIAHKCGRSILRFLTRAKPEYRMENLMEGPHGTVILVLGIVIAVLGTAVTVLVLARR